MIANTPQGLLKPATFRSALLTLALISTACRAPTAPMLFETRTPSSFNVGPATGAGTEEAEGTGASDTRTADGKAAGGTQRGSLEPNADSRAPVPRLWANASPESVFLKPPLDREQAKVVVQRFLIAVVEESLDDLASLVDDDTPARVSGRSRSQIAVQWWSQRFKALDYSSLRITDVYQDSATEVYTAEDLSELQPERDLGLTPEDEEVLVILNMPALTANIGGQLQRFFGPKIAFVVGITPSGYLIREVREDFRLR